MRRVLGIFAGLVLVLSLVLYFQLRAQHLKENGPSGGSATIEGTEVQVVSRISARIKALNVKEGDRVDQGQTLVELEAIEQNAVLREAEAAVALAEVGVEAAHRTLELARQGSHATDQKVVAAKASLAAGTAQKDALQTRHGAAVRMKERVGKLSESGNVSEQDIDKADSSVEELGQNVTAVKAQLRAGQAQVQATEEERKAAEIQVQLAEEKIKAAEQDLERAKAARERAKVLVSETTLKAPLAGIVQTRNFEPGEVVMPGSRVLTVVDVSEVKATFYLPNAELSAAVPGKEVRVVADTYPGEVFKGSIHHIATESEFTPRNVQTRQDRDRLVYGVEVAIPNPDGRLRPGMPVEVTIPRGNDK